MIADSVRLSHMYEFHMIQSSTSLKEIGILLLLPLRVSQSLDWYFLLQAMIHAASFTRILAYEFNNLILVFNEIP